MATDSRVLLTLYDGPARQLRPVTLPRLELYAQRHGFTLVELEPQQGLPAAWSKVRGLRDALASAEVALWVDADATVIDASRDVVEALGENWQALAGDPRFGPSTWLWAVRASDEAIGFLDTVWAQRSRDFGREWEQRPVRDLIKTENLSPVLLRDPWLADYGVVDAEVTFAHAYHTVGSWTDRAHYLRTGKLPDRPPLPIKRYPQRRLLGPYDAASAVSALLMAGGLLDRPRVCGELTRWGLPGEGNDLTVWVNPCHVFAEMRVDGEIRHFGCTESGGIGWQEQLHPHSGFEPRHWPT